MDLVNEQGSMDPWSMFCPHPQPGRARGGGGVLNKFLYGGGPPLDLLYSTFHDFVYLLLTNGTPFTYLA